MKAITAGGSHIKTSHFSFSRERTSTTKQRTKERSNEPHVFPSYDDGMRCDTEKTRSAAAPRTLVTKHVYYRLLSCILNYKLLALGYLGLGTLQLT